MYEFKHIDLDDYTDEEKRDAIRNHQKMIRYQKMGVIEQIMINLRNKGYSVTTFIVLLVGGGVWQQDRVKMFFNPTMEITKSEIITANSSNENVLKEFKLLLSRHGDSIGKLQKLLTKHIDSPTGH